MPLRRMFQTDVSDAFEGRGWNRQSGGQLYLDGNGGRLHPHLHLSVVAIPGTSDGRREIRMGVSMLAWSDGRQGSGGGGITYIFQGRPTINAWRADIVNRGMNANMAAEFEWIMSYHTEG